MEEVKALRDLIDQRGVSITEVAAACGVSWRTVHRWLKGENSPSAVYRKILARAIPKIEGIANKRG